MCFVGSVSVCVFVFLLRGVFFVVIHTDLPFFGCFTAEYDTKTSSAIFASHKWPDTE